MSNIKRYFQWIAGEKIGEIKTFNKIEYEDGINYIVFDDGTRINEEFVAPINQRDLTGKFMAEIDDPQNCWNFKEEWVGKEEEKWEKNADGVLVCVDPGNPGRKVVHLIPPKFTPKPSKFEQNLQEKEEQEKQEKQEKPKTEEMNENVFDKTTDPVYILISKSKKEDVDVEMTLTISLPSKSLYDISKNSFDQGDKKFIEYIIENISISKIKDSLKIAIKNMYESNSSNNEINNVENTK